jgi:nucleoside-diphosphate-sugar epimerase
MRIAIVGGAGFIGHHLAVSLAQAGSEVHVIDSLQVNNMLSIAASNSVEQHRDLYLEIINQRLESLRDSSIALIIQDARDYHALGRLLHEIQPHVVVHAAAVAHAGKSNKDPYSTFDHSLRTLENTLDYARNNVDHFIFLSSSMVYGDFQTDEVSEDHPLNSIGLYGALKVAGERIVIGYQQVFDLPYTIIRPSALYGPRCISRRVSQVFIENALHGAPLEVQGGGSETLDFTYIDDLVHGIERVIEVPGSKNETFNLTFGRARTIREVAEIVQESFPDAEIEDVERDRLMPRRGTLSIAKARELLGYEPQNPIEVGIPRYIEWYRALVPVAARD